MEVRLGGHRLLQAAGAGPRRRPEPCHYEWVLRECRWS